MTALSARALPVVPDRRWWLENVPCRTACPVHTDAGGYVTAIAQGRFADAYRIARAPNPFPSICGRVCAAPCERRCRRGALDAPVAIRALKRFVAERYGVEATGAGGAWHEPVAVLPPSSGRRVAIVGGGPAGLACAHDLRTRGHGVTLLEASGRLGGMMVRGIPPFRLPRAVIDAEIAAIVSLGVDVRLATRVGTDTTLDALLDAFDAVFVAAGTGVGRQLEVEGHQLRGVTSAVAFLADTFADAAPPLGEHVVVVGGGSVAFDAARTAARGDRNASDGEDRRSLLDVARTAKGATGRVREVTVVSVEARNELSADAEEWREAEREGIRMVHRRAVRRIVGDGVVQGVALQPVTQVFAPDGRFSPVVDDQSPEELIACDAVIMAVGQEADTSFLPLSLVRNGLVAVAPPSLRTANPRIWAGGDVAFGPRYLINAIADGKRAAAEIDDALSGRGAHAVDGRPPAVAVWGESAVARRVSDWSRQWSAYDLTPRAALPTGPATTRSMGREVEEVLDEATAVREADRCLRCHVNVTLLAERCILCGLCADVCPERCIQLRGAEAAVTLVLDEARCIRCGLCVARCPAQALTMTEVTGA